MSVGQLEGLGEPGAKALLAGDKQVTHLGCWCTLSYKIKCVDCFKELTITFLAGPVDSDRDCLAVFVPPSPPSLLAQLPQIPGQS